MAAYAELHCHSYFSFLDGASSPEALVQQAHTLGLTALALTDHDNLAGAVRFWKAAQRMGLHTVFGAEITMADGHHLTLLAEEQQGYANLCRLITAARVDQLAPAVWSGKVTPAVTWSRLAECRQGLIALTGCRAGPVMAPLVTANYATAQQALTTLYDIFGAQQLYLEVQHHQLPDDDRLIAQVLTLARSFALPCVVTNNVHYATPTQGRLRDALIAIQHHQSLTATRKAGQLPFNHTYYLTAPAVMARRFRHLPDALANSIAIAQRCQVSLDFSQQRLPTFPTPNQQSEFAYLYELCHDQLSQRYPRLAPSVLKQLAHELDVIERAGLAGYFLIVWDIVRFAREQEIRCQGRGSAANSIVAYLLGITSIDPLQHHLLFERFLSEDKFTMPDIDIDFAADRREEVIQYVYHRYGAAHTAMVCNVVTYGARSAVRDLSKALDFPDAVIDRLSKGLESHSPAIAAATIEAQVEVDAPPHHPLRLLGDLLRQIDGCPRHLSIHSGGMLITGAPLHELVPLEPATMPGRIVCQWDKESVEDAGLIKLDLLALRTLGMMSDALKQLGTNAPDLDAIPLDDPAIYRMLQQGDTIGAFQVESRAQQQMLPRLKPSCFEDIVIEVAIVRPGPIQGGAVHPYLRRRAGLEPVSYLHPSLAPVLAETLGVLLFQEQAIRVAVTMAHFTPGEADLLRRALSRNHAEQDLAALRQRFRQGAQGLDEATADAIFNQLAGFAGYGFCKSHAASFALIAYQTLWLKHYHPAAFYCALLNHQPMGFYSPEVLIHDAQRHGVSLLPPDINRSDWKYTHEGSALRTGLCAVVGLGEEGWQQLQRVRTQQPFQDLPDFCRRTRLPMDVITNLLRAGAMDDWGERRQLLWQLGNIEYVPAMLDLVMPILPVDLPALDALEQTVWEYELLGLSAHTQVMAHYRPALQQARVLITKQVKAAKPGQRVLTAGMVVVRQRPETAKGVVFVSIEDESGLLDLVVKPPVYERLRAVFRQAPLLMVTGIVQRSEGVVSVSVMEARPLG